MTTPRARAGRVMTDHACEAPGCIVIVPSDRERCHGCEGRLAGPMTVELLADYGAQNGETWAVVSPAQYNIPAGTSGNRIDSRATPHRLLVPVGAASSRSEGRD